MYHFSTVFSPQTGDKLIEVKLVRSSDPNRVTVCSFAGFDSFKNVTRIAGEDVYDETGHSGDENYEENVGEEGVKRSSLQERGVVGQISHGPRDGLNERVERIVERGIVD